MLARLAAKLGGDRVEAVLGDMAEPPVGYRRFAVVFVAYNTFFNLTEPDAQRRCLASVAAHLDPAGRFAVEAFVPDPDLIATGGAVEARTITADKVVLSATRLDVPRQELVGQYVDITEDGIRLRPWHIRWLTPDQLDVLGGVGRARPARPLVGLGRQTVRRRRIDPGVDLRPGASVPVIAIEITTNVDASPTEVWDRLRDLAGHVAWMADAEAIRFDPDQTEGGARPSTATPGSARSTRRPHGVTEWGPGRTMGVRHIGLVTGQRPVHARARRPAAARRPTWSERLRFPWWLGGPVGGRGRRPVMKRCGRQPAPSPGPDRRLSRA